MNAVEVKIYFGEATVSFSQASENLNLLQPKFYLECSVFFMAATLQDYMCKYMQEQTEPLEGCLLAALESKEHHLCLLVESLGTSVSSEDVKRSELLVDAGLFREEQRITRNGRNRYKLFFLTDAGRRLAERIKRDGYDGEIPQSVPAI